MNEADRQTALLLARNAIREFLETGNEIQSPVEPSFNELCGVFVSLKIDGELRGCIGYSEAQAPLGRTIIRCAIHSATEDPRFLPLTLRELDLVRIEISLLTPLQKINDPAEIEVGTHGIVIASGMRRGLLLPQVAIEYLWDRETFLRYSCQKAGLHDDAWKSPDTSIYVFSAEVFGEEKKPYHQAPEL
jgi:AmmeMemoRadiSam system protein A